MTTLVVVRHLEPSDIPPIVGMALHMHSLSPNYSDFEFDPQRFTSYLHDAICDPDWLVLVAHFEGDLLPAGILIAESYPKCFSNDVEASDRGIFTPYDGTGVGAAMVAEYVKWAREKGAKKILIQVESGIINKDILTGRLERSGFVPFGYSMVYGD